MRRLQRIRGWWTNASAPAERLAVLRIAVGAWTLWYLTPRFGMLARIARTQHELFDPVGLARFLPSPVPPVAHDFVLTVLLVVTALFTLGWKHRFIGPAFATLLLAVLSYKNSWSMIYHTNNGLVLQALVLGFSRSADAYSLDAHGRTSKEGWEYAWPIRLICMLIAITYFVAGVAKLASPLGFHWGAGEILRSQVAVDAIRKVAFGDVAPSAFSLLYDQVFLFAALGTLTLILELGAPVFILQRQTACAWVLSVWGMHWGILFIMGIEFRYQLVGLLFLSFFEVERPVRRLNDWFMTRRPRWV